MEIVGVISSTASLVDLTLKYGKCLYDLYRNYVTAEESVAERVLILENRWLRVEAQIKFLQQCWPQLPEHLRIHFNSVHAIINAKLILATQMLEGVIQKQEHGLDKTTGHGPVRDLMSGDGKVRRGAFAVKLKKSLDNIIQDLDAWRNNLLDPAWYSLVLIPTSMSVNIAQVADGFQDKGDAMTSLRHLIKANEELYRDRDDAYISSDSIELLEYPEIEFSASRLACQIFHKRLVILDRVNIPTQYDWEKAREDTCILSMKLSSKNSNDFGILQSLGVADGGSDLDLVFAFPKGYDDLTSLRRLLIDAKENYALNGRLHLATMLARSVAFLHTCRTVHKNIRPENVVCFSTTQEQKPHQPYLIGLEQFRHIDATSMRASDNVWQRDIYRHPSRQGLRPEQDYIMQHDIYSLGVCLLEIGLWTSFLEMKSLDVVEKSEEVNANSKYIDPKDLAVRNPRLKARKIQRRFVTIAEEKLPGMMGQKYRDIVVACLTCLDSESSNFGDEEEFSGEDDKRDENEDEVLIGIRYIEKILTKLLAIVV